VAVVPSRINFPYHSGDVVWVGGDDSVSMPITVEDTKGLVAFLASQRSEDPTLFEERSAGGEMPLSNSTGGGLASAFDPEAIDQWGYTYSAIQRPGVRVREMVGTDETFAASSRSNQTHLAQRGMGVAGDLPNDIRWQFGAAVFKRPEQAVGEVAIYASLAVEISDEDLFGPRVFPPFRGAAGGPGEGPLMMVKGQEIDLFLMPTAVRPGAVLEVGDRFVFAGQLGPLLASQVSVFITSPSGRVRSINGQANPVGYFFDPGSDFFVDEPGLWTVVVRVLHDGLTSAGPVQRTPTGGILGSVDGRFEVYVVPQGGPSLDLRLPDLSFMDSPVTKPVRLFFPLIDDGWTNVEGIYTISMPGFILEQGSLTRRTAWLEGVYDPARLALSFPNLDLTARHELTTGLSDQVFFSVLLTGLDPNGVRGYAAKMLTLVGEDVYDLN
jgi:hypothetical protein